MTKTMHTPGPWVGNSDTTNAIDIVAGGRSIAMVIAESDELDLTDEANALLIAAAPDLLAVCKEFVRRVEAGEIRSKRTYAAMKAAIARSEGESNE